MLVPRIKAKGCKTFQDYAELVFTPYFNGFLERDNVKRIDIVFDIYIKKMTMKA